MLIHSLISECFHDLNEKRWIVAKPKVEHESSSDNEFSHQEIDQQIDWQRDRRPANSVLQSDMFHLSLELFKQILTSAIKSEATIAFELTRFWNLVSGRNLDEAHLNEVCFEGVI